MRTFWQPLVLLALATLPLQAQNEAALKQYFEGRTLTVKLDMPATEQGVDVFPDASPAIDFNKYAQRIKTYGTAIHNGQSMLVTKIKVKDKLIEFQLGGGGFGTFSDNTSTSVYTPTAEKTKRERDIEHDLKTETEPAARRKLQEELDGLKRDREREDARLKAMTADAQEKKRETVRTQALGAGSRFNLRFAKGVPASALTPEAIMRALDDYLDFSTVPGDGISGSTALAGANTGAGRPDGACQIPAVGNGGLRKGLSRAEVETLMGKPERATERSEGSLKVVAAVYSSSDSHIEAEFVEGVLVRYAISSR
ncbi:MAG: hypothetical protein ABJD11_14425 [Gemmatimonadota bacterium]